MHDKEIKDLHDKIDELRNDMQPIIDTFKTLRIMGKWIAVSVGFMASFAGLILAVRDFFKKI